MYIKHIISYSPKPQKTHFVPDPRKRSVNLFYPLFPPRLSNFYISKSASTLSTSKKWKTHICDGFFLIQFAKQLFWQTSSLTRILVSKEWCISHRVLCLIDIFLCLSLAVSLRSRCVMPRQKFQSEKGLVEALYLNLSEKLYNLWIEPSGHSQIKNFS